jgi:orotidine-5'-phosphate decarboxylase
MINFNQEDFNKFVLENDVYGFFEEPLTLKSGRKSHFYANWRNVVEDVWLTDKLSNYIISFVKDNNLDVDTFYGVPEGATKIAVISQYKWAKESGFTKGSHILSMGRARPKEHGQAKDKFFIGVPRGRVIIIEDVTTTGGSTLNAIDNLNEMGINVVGIISLTNRMERRDDGKSVKEAIEDKGIRFYSMSSSLEILPKAIERNNPPEEVVNHIKSEFELYGVKPLDLDLGSLGRFENMVDILYRKMDEKQTPLCIGLDPNLKKFPKHILNEVLEEFGATPLASAEAIKRFNFSIIDSTCDLVSVFKPQIAYYEQYGSYGIRALEETIKYAKSKGAVVILDAKRNDIGPTSEAYAEAHIGKTFLPDGTTGISLDNPDFITVNGYLGSDGILPFVKVANRNNKGIFVLAKTSNPSSGELQDLKAENREEIYKVMARLINQWGKENIGKSGYSNVGAVVGATYPEEAKELRRILPKALFLMPGYGKQGGKAEILVNGFDENGRGAIVNSSRAINYAFSDQSFKEKYPFLAKSERFAEAARQATIDAIKDINNALRNAGKLPKGWTNF